MNALKFGFAAALGLSVLAAGTAQAGVQSTFDPDATLEGAVRYRNMGNQGGTGTREIQIGTSSSSGGVASPAEGDLTWLSSNTVKFIYPPTDKLRTTTTPASTPSPVQKDLTTPLGTLNYLEIAIAKNSTSTTLNLNDVSLSVGTTTHQLGNFQGSGNPTRWKVTGYDLTAGFELTGTLVRSGTFTGVDGSYVQIDVGYVPPSDTEGPEVTSMAITPAPVLLNGEATVRATIDDTNKGSNSIASAEYSLNGGAWSPMTAQDGTFNQVAEDVQATFEAMEIGENEVCVRGYDSLGNEGDEECQTFMVTYKLAGFFSPIDNNFVNVAKAGQAVPAKWRLTDANDWPIEDPGSFVGLYSYPVSCTDFQGNPTDAVEEYAPGSSTLQYNGDGNWQFNWKTPKEYANSPNNCRALYVALDSGQDSPGVRFQFKK